MSDELIFLLYIVMTGISIGVWFATLDASDDWFSIPLGIFWPITLPAIASYILVKIIKRKFKL